MTGATASLRRLTTVTKEPTPGVPPMVEAAKTPAPATTGLVPAADAGRALADTAARSGA